jgi:hypothetical protein
MSEYCGQLMRVVKFESMLSTLLWPERIFIALPQCRGSISSGLDATLFMMI